MGWACSSRLSDNPAAGEKIGHRSLKYLAFVDPHEEEETMSRLLSVLLTDAFLQSLCISAVVLRRQSKPSTPDPNASPRSPQIDIPEIKAVLCVRFLWELVC